jgi:hypothetical protein
MDGFWQIYTGPEDKEFVDPGKIPIIVGVYRQIMHAARRAALATISMFSPILGRDCSCLIAKLVYAMRIEAPVWYRDEQLN